MHHQPKLKLWFNLWFYPNPKFIPSKKSHLNRAKKRENGRKETYLRLIDITCVLDPSSPKTTVFTVFVDGYKKKRKKRNWGGATVRKREWWRWRWWRETVDRWDSLHLRLWKLIGIIKSHYLEYCEGPENK